MPSIPQRLTMWVSGGSFNKNLEVHADGWDGRPLVPYDPAERGPLKISLFGGVRPQNQMQSSAGWVRPSQGGGNGSFVQNSSSDGRMIFTHNEQITAANQSRPRAPPANIMPTFQPEQHTSRPATREDGLRSAYPGLENIKAETRYLEQESKKISKADKEYQKVIDRHAVARQTYERNMRQRQDRETGRRLRDEKVARWQRENDKVHERHEKQEAGSRQNFPSTPKSEPEQKQDRAKDKKKDSPNRDNERRGPGNSSSQKTPPAAPPDTSMSGALETPQQAAPQPTQASAPAPASPPVAAPPPATAPAPAPLSAPAPSPVSAPAPAPVLVSAPPVPAPPPVSAAAPAPALVPAPTPVPVPAPSRTTPPRAPAPVRAMHLTPVAQPPSAAQPIPAAQHIPAAQSSPPPPIPMQASAASQIPQPPTQAQQAQQAPPSPPIRASSVQLDNNNRNSVGPRSTQAPERENYTQRRPVPTRGRTEERGRFRISPRSMQNDREASRQREHDEHIPGDNVERHQRRNQPRYNDVEQLSSPSSSSYHTSRRSDILAEIKNSGTLIDWMDEWEERRYREQDRRLNEHERRTNDREQILIGLLQEQQRQTSAMMAMMRYPTLRDIGYREEDLAYQRDRGHGSDSRRGRRAESAWRTEARRARVESTEDEYNNDSSAGSRRYSDSYRPTISRARQQPGGSGRHTV